MKIITSPEDDFLYDRIIELLSQVKLVQGGSAIPATLRRHKVIKDYLMEKQSMLITHIENTYFEDGDLNQFAIEKYLHKKSLQKFNNNVN